MTKEQIAGIVRRSNEGGYDGDCIAVTQEDVMRLLNERVALLEALREVTVRLGDARSVLSHCWASEQPPTNQDWLDAETAEDVAEKAIAKAEAE